VLFSVIGAGGVKNERCFMKLLFRIILIAPLLILSLPLSSQSLDKQTVLERIIHAYGGEENLRKLDSMVQEWDFVALMGNRHGTDIRSVRIPDQLKVELKYPDKTETRLLNGDIGRVIFNGRGVQIAAQRQTDAMRLQLMRLYSPLVLRDRSESIKLVIDGDYCALILDENGVQAIYLVNQEIWRIEKVAGVLKINGAEMKFLTEYSDFKFVDGVLVHQKENKFAGNVNTAKLLLRQITFDAALNDENFLPE
jgi:hypothetical protein